MRESFLPVSRGSAAFLIWHTTFAVRVFKAIFPLLLIIAVTTVFALPYHSINVFDGGDYLRLAMQLNAGHWPLRQDFYAARIFTYLPYAIGIRFCGYGQWLTYITLLELLVLLTIVYWVLAKASRYMAFVTIAVLGTSSVLLQSSTLIMGDTLITLTANVIILLYLLLMLRENKNIFISGITGAAAACAFGISIWVKEAILFYIPLLMYLYIKDRNDMLLKEFWRCALRVSLWLIALTLIVYAVKTGNPLGRIISVENFSQINYPLRGYQAVSLYAIFLRCTVQPVQFLMQDYTFAVLFLLSLLHVAQPAAYLWQKRLKAFFILTITVWWLGSLHLFTWNPMPLIHRLWLPLVIPMALNGVTGAFNFCHAESFGKAEKTRYSVIILLFLIAAHISLFVSKTEYARLGISALGLQLSTLALTGVSIILLSAVHTRWWVQKKAALCLLLFSALAAPQVAWQAKQLTAWIHRGCPSAYRGEKQMVEEVKKLAPSLVLTDAGLSRNYGIYDGFQSPLPFVFYMTFPYDSLPDGTFLLLNKAREKANAVNMMEAKTFLRAKNKIPEFVLHPEQHHFYLLNENETNQLYVLRRQFPGVN